MGRFEQISSLVVIRCVPLKRQQGRLRSLAERGDFLWPLGLSRIFGHLRMCPIFIRREGGLQGCTSSSRAQCLKGRVTSRGNGDGWKVEHEGLISLPNHPESFALLLNRIFAELPAIQFLKRVVVPLHV